MDAREQRGLQIASAGRIRNKGQAFIVPSQTHAGSYVVDPAAGQPSCSCPDHEIGAYKCKHIWAVEIARTREVMPDGTEKVVETMRVTDTQEWASYNAAQTHEEEHFMRLLRGLCDGITQPLQGKGRPKLPLADVAVRRDDEGLHGHVGRRATTDIRDAHAKGHMDKAAHYNTSCC